ncbi:MAG: hypothetical protein IPN13_11690 [Bacteroidetes bacterium]|nr:hypothetical protein [Bacteroidota bacterium]
MAVNQTVAQTDYEIKKSPQTILLTNRPAPVTIQIPTKAGGYFIKDYGEGITRKINLMPPVSVPLPIVSKNANGEALSEQILAGKGFLQPILPMTDYQVMRLVAQCLIEQGIFG